MIKAGIIGGAGYTAGELIRLLLNHKQTTIDFVYSTSNAGNKVYKVHQDLVGSTEMEFTNDINELDFVAPKTVKENGTANYRYEIISASDIAFKARAEAITDFDGDGILNVWEIDENGNPKQITKD